MLLTQGDVNNAPCRCTDLCPESPLARYIGLPYQTQVSALYCPQTLYTNSTNTFLESCFVGKAGEPFSYKGGAGAAAPRLQRPLLSFQLCHTVSQVILHRPFSRRRYMVTSHTGYQHASPCNGRMHTHVIQYDEWLADIRDYYSGEEVTKENASSKTDTPPAVPSAGQWMTVSVASS